jgi:hypothetical protein
MFDELLGDRTGHKICRERAYPSPKLRGVLAGRASWEGAAKRKA